METRSYSPKLLQQRRFYMVLPVLVLPFLTFFYWVTVAKNADKTTATTAEPTGLNTSLPDASLKETRNMDKLSYYQKAAEDSAKRADQIKKDPYRQQQLSAIDTLHGVALQGLAAPGGNQKKTAPVIYKGRTYSSPNEAKVYGKLKELDAVLAQSTQPGFEAEKQREGKILMPVEPIHSPDADGIVVSADMQKIESLLAGIQGEDGPESQDPEMQELNAMLEKVMDIQHPERVSARLVKETAKTEPHVLPVSSQAGESLVTTLVRNDSLTDSSAADLPFQQNGFFSLDEPVAVSQQNAIPAVIHQDQQLITGSTVKLRLTSDIYVGGILVPKDSFVFGSASLNGERLLVEVASIRSENSLLPVKLSVYDLDGNAGIYIPGAISRDVAKQSLSQDIQGISIGTLDPSLGAQAASAGIQAAKTLMGKKARLVQVHVKAGYQVLLRDSNARSI